MRLRTLVGLIAALIAAISLAYLFNRNGTLLQQPFGLTDQTTIPLYGALLVAFLLGFVPAAGVLVTQTLKRDLARRRKRRRSREVKSLKETYRRATDFLSDGQWGKAAAELEGVLADQPEDFATLLDYGEVLRHQGKSAEALEVHRRASVLYPRSVAVLHQLAEDYEVSGEVEVARQIRDRVLRDFPGRGLQILRRRRNGAIGRKNWREAGRLQERIESMLEESGATVDLEREAGLGTGLAYQVGVDHLEADQLEEAERIFGGLLEQHPLFQPARIMLGEVEVVRNRGAAAVEIWREGFAATGNPVFLERIEDHFIEIGQPVEGIETFHQLAAVSENALLPSFFLGRLYARLEMHDEALKILTPLEDRIRRAPGFRFLLGRLYARRGEMNRSVEALTACAQEAGMATVEYGCRICRTNYPDWRDRCDICGSWSSVDLEFEEEGLGSEVGEGGAGRTSAVYHGEFGGPERDDG